MKNTVLKPESIKIIQLKGKKALFFHSDTLQIYPLDDIELTSFLERYSNGDCQGLISQYGKKEFDKSYGIINDIINDSPQLTNFDLSQYEVPNGVFNTVVLPISGHCTLACPYCFAHVNGKFNFDDFTTDGIEKAIDFSVSNVNGFSTDSPLCFVFFGGEPLMRFDLIKHAINYAKTRYADRNIAYSITTNGTILTDEIIQTFKENKFSVLVSIDGPDNEFNLRKDLSGRKSFYKVLGFIKTLKNNGIYTELRATLVNTNPYIVETFDFFEKQELPFFVSFAYTSENKDHHWAEYNNSLIESIKSQFDNLLDYYIGKIEKHEIIYNKKFYQINEILRFRQNKRIACGAGRTYFTITSSGNIFSCAHFMNQEEHSIGNINKVEITPDSYKAIKIEEIGECSTCWAKHLCLGHCVSQKISLGKRNDTATTIEECELEKIKMELYVKLYYYTKTLAPYVYEKRIENDDEKIQNDC